MSRIAYVNGRYLPRHAATVHIEDRGYQFSDGVYEVCEVRGGRLVDERLHIARLTRSLDELRIAMPMSSAALGAVIRETARRNRVSDGIVYLQITRGVARRDHAFPPAGTAPSVVVTARNLDFAGNEKTAADGIAVITVPDNRWERVDIKSVSLLPNVLAKQAAREQGAKEAWFVDRAGKVTEGSSTNAWIVTMNGEVVTRPADHRILRGITRTVLLDAIRAQGLEFVERAFTVEEAYGAREAFVTSASMIVMPVVRIDGRPIGNGAPGLIATALRRDFHRHAEFS
jgi:D-alanine transaminase